MLNNEAPGNGLLHGKVAVIYGAGERHRRGRGPCLRG